MGIKDDAYAHPELATAIAAKDCHEIARVLSIGRVKKVLVPLSDVQELMQRTGAWWSISAAAADKTHPANAAAVAVVDVAAARYSNLDTSLPLVSQMLGSLVATGVMPQALLDQITAMSLAPDDLTQREVAVAIYNDDGTPL